MNHDSSPQTAGAVLDSLKRVGTRASERLLELRASALHVIRPTQQPSKELLDPDDWSWLWRPGLIGFAALIAIAVGGSFSNSPFKLEMPGTWFFGVPSANTAATDHGNEALLLLGLLLVYGGLVLLIRTWIQLSKALIKRPGAPIGKLAWILVLWVIPMLVVAPMFSRDVFSYAAQGEMVSRHINPYTYGPFTLGSGPYVNPVDPLWGNTPAPYGPLFLMIDGFFASVTFHSAIGTVICLRVLELVSVAALAWCIPKLARTVHRDEGQAFVLAVLNPIVILTLIGGAHNDAMMVALLVGGITASRLKHPVWGVVLCALAAAVKAPAAIGILYIAWDWLGPNVSLRNKLRPIAVSAIIAGAVLGVLTLLSGLGLGWVGNLATPGTVRSWVAPSTGLGMGIAGLLHVVGIGVSQSAVISATRLLGLGLAAVLGVWLLKESDRIGQLTALGLTLLAFVILSPVIQPWYLAWGLILLAPVAEGRIRTAVIVLSAGSPFIGLPGARELVTQLLHAQPLMLAVTLVALLAFVLAPLGRWTSLGQLSEPVLVPAGAEDANS